MKTRRRRHTKKDFEEVRKAAIQCLIENEVP